MGLGLAEGGLRVAGFHPRLRHQHLLHSRAWTVQPGLGLVPRRLLKPLEGDCVALGDSFTEGFPGPLKESYPAQLDWLNVGMGDSGPSRQLAVFQGVVLPQVRPRLVVWQFYRNDRGDDGDFPTGDSWVVRRQRWAWLDALYLGRLLLWAGQPAFPGEVSVGPQVDEMERLSHQLGFRLVLLLVAPEGGTPWVDESHARLRAELQDRPGFVEARIRSFATGDPNAVGDRHLSAEGYRELANTVRRASTTADPPDTAAPSSGRPAEPPRPPAPPKPR